MLPEMGDCDRDPGRVGHDRYQERRAPLGLDTPEV